MIRHSLVRNFLFTTGVDAFREDRNCYWLVDAIASHQLNPELLAARKSDPLFDRMQIWTLTPADGGGAVLEARADLPGPVLVRQEIPYTDFDGEAKFYVVAEGDVVVMMLTEEY